MWAAIKLFFSTNAVRVMEYAAIAMAFAGVLLEVFTAGKKSEKVDELQTVQKEVGVANAVQDQNKMRPDGAALDELQSKWSR